MRVKEQEQGRWKLRVCVCNMEACGGPLTWERGVSECNTAVTNNTFQTPKHHQPGKANQRPSEVHPSSITLLTILLQFLYTGNVSRGIPCAFPDHDETDPFRRVTTATRWDELNDISVLSDMLASIKHGTKPGHPGYPFLLECPSHHTHGPWPMELRSRSPPVNRLLHALQNRVS